MIFLGDGKYQNVKLGRVTLIIAVSSNEAPNLIPKDDNVHRNSENKLTT